LEPDVVDQGAELAEGLDGRQLRKAVAAACAIRAEAQGNPARVSGEDLLTALRELGGRS
jgi:hypothetical protein